MAAKYGNKIKSIDKDTLWPDAWKVMITIKSLVPNNFNTHIDYYVNGLNTTSLINLDASFQKDTLANLTSKAMATAFDAIDNTLGKQKTGGFKEMTSELLNKQSQLDRIDNDIINAENEEAKQLRLLSEGKNAATVADNIHFSLNRATQNYSTRLAEINSDTTLSESDKKTKIQELKTQYVKDTYDIVSAASKNEALSASDKAFFSKYARDLGVNIGEINGYEDAIINSPYANLTITSSTGTGISPTDQQAMFYLAGKQQQEDRQGNLDLQLSEIETMNKNYGTTVKGQIQSNIDNAERNIESARHQQAENKKAMESLVYGDNDSNIISVE